MKIPTDPIEASIFMLNLVIESFTIEDAYTRLANGISAKAQAEGRDVNEDEEQMLDVILEASKRARDGK
jgi:hypothetical protein